MNASSSTLFMGHVRHDLEILEITFEGLLPEDKKSNAGSNNPILQRLILFKGRAFFVVLSTPDQTSTSIFQRQTLHINTHQLSFRLNQSIVFQHEMQSLWYGLVKCGLTPLHRSLEERETPESDDFLYLMSSITSTRLILNLQLTLINHQALFVRSIRSSNQNGCVHSFAACRSLPRICCYLQWQNSHSNSDKYVSIAWSCLRRSSD